MAWSKSYPYRHRRLPDRRRSAVSAPDRGWRCVKTLLRLFRWFGEERTTAWPFIRRDMWKPNLKVVKKQAVNAVHGLDRLHIARQEPKTLKVVLYHHLGERPAPEVAPIDSAEEASLGKWGHRGLVGKRIIILNVERGFWHAACVMGSGWGSQDSFLVPERDSGVGMLLS